MARKKPQKRKPKKTQNQVNDNTVALIFVLACIFLPLIILSITGNSLTTFGWIVYAGFIFVVFLSLFKAKETKKPRR